MQGVPFGEDGEGVAMTRRGLVSLFGACWDAIAAPFRRPRLGELIVRIAVDTKDAERQLERLGRVPGLRGAG